MNDYTYWNEALALGAHINDDRDHRITSDPQAGFYRTKDNRPVAIWYDEDGCNMTIDQQPVPENRHEDTWLWIARRPVTEDQYRAFIQTGRWHDIDPAVDETLGHNIAGATDPETIQRLITLLQSAANNSVPIQSDEESKRAHSLRARINELRLRAQKRHDEEKEPHLRAGQAVDQLWNPMIKDATAAGTMLAKAMGKWEDDKIAALRKAQREEEERRQREEAMRRAGETPPPPPPPQAPLPEPTDTIRSGHGRAAAVRTKAFVTAITDIDALFQRYRDHEEVHAVLLKLAQRAVDRGLTVEGVKVEDKAVVR